VATHQVGRLLHHLLGEAEPKEGRFGHLRPHLGVAEEAVAAHLGVIAAGQGLAGIVVEGGQAGLEGSLRKEPEEVEEDGKGVLPGREVVDPALVEAHQVGELREVDP
jgi:hypothetical protein